MSKHRKIYPTLWEVDQAFKKSPKKRLIIMGKTRVGKSTLHANLAGLKLIACAPHLKDGD